MKKLALSCLVLVWAGTIPAAPEEPGILERCPKGASAWVADVWQGEIVHLGDPSTVSREGEGKAGSGGAHLALILDASGSMRAELPGSGRTKLAVAKEVMGKLVPGIPAEVTASLWAYGHRAPQKPKTASCRDIEQVIGPGPVDAAAYMEKVEAMNAIGYTPIADSIRRAAAVLPEGASNSIVLVSDGEETCGGDPCALAAELKASGASVTIHVVAYAVQEAEREQLRCIARSSGGTYHDAGDPEALLDALREATETAWSETLLRVETMDPDGAEIRADVEVTRVGSDGEPARHTTWTDNAVFPGEVDLLVRSTPAILYRELTLGEGTTTVVRIPLGVIHVLSPDRKGTRYNLHDAGTARRIGQRDGRIVVAPGCYQVEVVGMGDRFTVDPGEVEEIILATIRVLDPGGKGARFSVLDGRTEQWLVQRNGVVHLVPGTFRVSAVRASDPFRLGSGETREIVLGAIRVEDPGGKDARFSVRDPASGKWLAQHNGTLLLMPGPYRLHVQSDGETEEIGPGEIRTVRLGLLKVGAPFTLFDAAGKRIGHYRKDPLLAPGAYRVEVDGGPVFEKVELKAGEVKALR
jgi:hypothetical protein